MKIGIDARPLSNKRSAGVGRYLFELLSIMITEYSCFEYYLYTHKNLNNTFEDMSNVKVRKCVWLPGDIAMQTLLEKKIRDDGINVFWGTTNLLPLNLPKDIKKVVTVHDITWFFYPKTMKRYDLLIYKLFFLKSLKSSDKVISVSESTKRDICKYFDILPEKIHVIYPGVGKNFKSYSKEESFLYLSKKYNIPTNYILFVGSIEPRKNLINIIKAFRLIVDYGFSDLFLVIVGGKGWRNSCIYKKLKSSDILNRIILTGYIDDCELPKFYSGAKVLIFPSLYEGFGFPIIEAMTCGCPVVTSNVSSMPELSGNAAILVNPHNPEDIFKGILKAFREEKELILKGHERAKIYTFRETARKTVELILQCSG